MTNLCFTLNLQLHIVVKKIGHKWEDSHEASVKDFKNDYTVGLYEV